MESKKGYVIDIVNTSVETVEEHDTKLLDKVAERIKIRLIDNLGLEDAIKYGNKNAKQQANSYATVMKYEIADSVNDLLDDLAEMKAEEVR